MTSYDFSRFALDARYDKRDRKGQFATSNLLTDKRLKEQHGRGEIDDEEALRLQFGLQKQADGSYKDVDDRYHVKPAGAKFYAATKHPEQGWISLGYHDSMAEAIAAVGHHQKEQDR